jgi:small subunit ribosomal protein S6
MRPSLGEERFTEIIERTCSVIKKDGGAIIDINRWGVKKLAYPVKKETQGCYVCMNYAAVGSSVKEIERLFRIDDSILRYLTVKLADEIDEVGIEQVKERIAALAAKAAAEAKAQEDGRAQEDGADDAEEL